MSEIEQKALRFLRQPRTCTELGEHLWGTPYRRPQSYARPAGALIARRRAKRAVVLATEAARTRGRRNLWIAALDVRSEVQGPSK